MSETPPVTEAASAELDRIAGAVDHVFGGTPTHSRVCSHLERARNQLEEIATGRDVDVEIISVLGVKNSGKSWLCSRLLTRPEDREKIEVGFDRSTEKVCWIGSEFPNDLQPELESRIPIEEGGLIDLGRPYVLLDVPGFDDMREHAREAAEKLTAVTSLRVFVASSETWHQADASRYLRGSQGTRILPFMVDDHFYDRSAPEAERLSSDYLEHLRKGCPDSDTAILEPVFLPRVDNPVKGKKDPAADAEAIVHKAMRSLANGPKVDRRVMAGAQVDLLKLPLRRELKGFLSHVERPYEKLVEAEQAAAKKVADQLLGRDRDLESGIRLRLLMELSRRTPSWCFPYRAILTMFAWCSGAIDRLILSFTGSLPSLAQTVIQTSRNAKKLAEMGERAQIKVRERAEQLARDELQVKNEIFLRSVFTQLPDDSTSKRYAEISRVRLEGMTELQQRYRDAYEEEIEESPASKWGIRIFAVSGFVVFWGIGLAPLVAVYRKFFESWLPSFAASEAPNWTEFPAPSGQMILATLALMLIPVIVIALIAVAWGGRKSRVASAHRKIKAQHQEIVTDVTISQGGLPPRLRVTSEDPFREAILTLLDFCMKKKTGEENS